MTDTEKLLGKAYVKVLRANLNTEEFRALCLREDERIEGEKLSDWIEIFANEGNIREDDRNDFLHVISIPRMKACDSLSFDYHRLINGKFVPVRLEMFKSTEWTEDNPIVIIAVQYLSENTDAKTI